jgi:hypothetical protein
MMDEKLIETVADIAYIFGSQGYFSGDSRADIQEVIFFAKEFEKQNNDWEKEDYLRLITEYSNSKLQELRSLNQMAE